MTKRLVSWNICHGGGKRYPEIIAHLRAWQPDAVGLSEFRGTAPSQSIASALAEMGLAHQHSTVDVSGPNRRTGYAKKSNGNDQTCHTLD